MSNITNSNQDKSIGYDVGSKGGEFPVVEINSSSFGENGIRYFNINSNGKIPTLDLTLKIEGGTFISTSFPKDGDLVSVFVRSKISELKPLRGDYIITSVQTSKSKDPTGNALKISITAELRVPRLHASLNKAFRNLTTMEVVLEVAKDLGLGVVTNIEPSSLKDKMNWVAANETYFEFLDRIISHAYSDQMSFYTFWIDQYYNLNFSELNKMHSIEDTEEGSEGKSFQDWMTDYNSKSKNEFEKTPNLLTNQSNARKSASFIQSHQLLNQSGNINNKFGYRNNINFFDFELKKPVSFTIEPSITKYKEPKVAPLGRSHETSYKDEVKKSWAGWAYTMENHNTHQFFKEAEYQNKLNMLQLYKLRLKVQLNVPNFNFYKGQRIPIVIVNDSESERQEKSSWKKDDAKHQGYALDRFLSGSYVIQGINFIFKNLDSKGKWVTEITLSRREWTMPQLEN